VVTKGGVGKNISMETTGMEPNVGTNLSVKQGGGGGEIYGLL
jgi:hypothetical protein